MAQSPPKDNETTTVRQATVGARKLADAMPRLILEARRIATTVIHGLHGRRRAGPGENFWQYRRFVSGEPAQHVDWRRTARGRSGTDATDCEPQRDRKNGRIHSARSYGTGQSAAFFRALAAVRGRYVVRPVVTDRRRPCHNRTALGHWRAWPRCPDCGSGRREFPLFWSCGIYRAGRRRQRHSWTGRNMA